MSALAKKSGQLLPEHVALKTGEGTLAVSLRRHPRARNYTLRVKSTNGPVLTMPARGSLHDARAFLDRHAGWLLCEMGKLPEPQPIIDGGLVPLRGVAHRVRHLPERRGTVSAVTHGEYP